LNFVDPVFWVFPWGEDENALGTLDGLVRTGYTRWTGTHWVH